jgi:hypothetical protein
MERVTGIGGVFFRSKDPEMLGRWYATHLGVDISAARLYAEAARSAPSLPERDHLTRQAARLNVELRS